MKDGAQGSSAGNVLRNRKVPPPDYNVENEEVKNNNNNTSRNNKKKTRRRKNKKQTPKAPSATYYISAWTFGRMMGLLYIIAFISTWVQIHGLIGEGGISPMSEYFTRLSTNTVSMPSNFLTHPSIFWINQSDRFLHIICGIGSLSGVLLFMDIFPAICSALCWILFLSISIAGQTFFMYQWDLLLLESGFIMIFFHSFHWSWIPFSQNPRDFHPPDALFWLFRLLLFRINFTRGVQELLSKDRVWRTLSSFDFHFETQPSPTIFSWYLHQLPSLFHQGMVFWVLTVEIGVVFLIFGPQLFRRTACLYILLLQVFYILSGNFGTYHWNVCALCFLLLDDAMFPGLIRKLTRVRRKLVQKRASGSKKISSSQPRIWHKRLSMMLAVFLIVISTVPISTISQSVSTPQPLRDIYRKVHPFRIVNMYGPFYRIPHERFELHIQGSLDAQTWINYDFLYKPDEDLTRWPPFLSPHISRLEYQLWMAAQTDYQQEVWYVVVLFCFVFFLFSFIYFDATIK